MKEKIKAYNEMQATYVCQFEHALTAREEVLAIDSKRIILTAHTPGKVVSVIHSRADLVDMANQTAFRRWMDLKNLNMVDVANDLLYQHEVRRYL